MAEQLSVLLVDDHPIVRAGCRKLLESELKAAVIEAEDAESAYRLFVAERPGVVVLDLTLPGAGGLAVLERMRAWDPGARVVVFSMHEEAVFAARALKAGAIGYVPKSRPPQELVEAVRQAARGEPYLAHGIAQKLALTRLVDRGGDPLGALSARELEIIRMLAQGRSAVQIAALLCLSYKTVVNAITALKAKLGAASSGELVRIALQHGIISG